MVNARADHVATGLTRLSKHHSKHRNNRGFGKRVMTDEELMLAVCNGDQCAYQTIVKKHLKPISHYAYRMLGNTKDTEEISQETFLRLWTNAARWQTDKANLSTWLHRIAHNLCIDYLRRHRRTLLQVEIRPEPDAEDFYNPGAALELENEQGLKMDANATARRLQQALQELPESQRSALMLCHYQGFSNKEAAVIMDISVKALESAIARAKRTLRTTLSEHNETDLTQNELTQNELTQNELSQTKLPQTKLPQTELTHPAEKVQGPE